MKKCIMWAVALLMSVVVFAQTSHGKRDPKERANNQSETMKNVLDLSEQQYASVKKINGQYADKALAVRRDSSRSGDVNRNEIRSLRAERQRELNAVLTPEQQQKWKTFREERREKERAEHEKRKAEHLKDLKSSLSLSEDQVKKLESERLTFRNKIKGVHDDTSLTPDKKKEKVKALRKEHESVVKSILSAEQFEKWKSMKKYHKRPGRGR